MSIKKEQYISFILGHLQLDKTYTDTFKLFKGKFKLTEPTFAKYWKMAKAEHLERMQALREKKEAIYAKEQLKSHTKGVKTAMQQRKEISEKIDALEKELSDERQKKDSKLSDIFRMEKMILDYRAELNKMIGAYKEHNQQKNKPTTITFKKYSDK